MTEKNIENSSELLKYIVAEANSGVKNWFGFHQQRIAGIYVAYELAKNHANTMTPKEITAYVKELNDRIYADLVKGN